VGAALLTTACGGDDRRLGEDDFETVRVSVNGSDLAQGETEIVVDGQGDVVVVWMDGSPGNETQLTLRSTRSRDGARSFAPDQLVAPGVLLADPTLAVDDQGGVVLAALRKNSLIGWSDVDVVGFRDTGSGWTDPVVLNAEGVFNDRPWLGRRSDGGLIVAFGRRTPLLDGDFDRPVFVADVPPAGAPSAPPKRLVNPPEVRPPDSAGGSPRTVVTAGDRVVIGYQEIPADNADRFGSGTYSAAASALISEDGGATFGPPVPITTPATVVADAGGEGVGEGLDASLQPFPRLATDGRSVVAVWIGPAGRRRDSVVHCAVLERGATAFEPPVEVMGSEAEELTLPTVAVDGAGRAHVFWLGRGPGRLWSLRYTASDDGCSGFGEPQAVSAMRFPLRQWPGDFMAATVHGRDVLVAWPVAGGLNAGVYVSVGRGLARE
jgi:hypothetical protein